MENYISLKEASKYCNYSQDYLKLRARQGKFKAIKIGRNWVTTKDWLGEYSSKAESPRRDRVLRFGPIFLIAGLGLMVFLFLLFAEFNFRAKDFLANIGSLIPSRVVEIK